MTIDDLIAFLKNLIDEENCDKKIDWCSINPNEGFEIYYKDNTYQLKDFENGRLTGNSPE